MVLVGHVKAMMIVVQIFVLLPAVSKAFALEAPVLLTVTLVKRIVNVAVEHVSRMMSIGEHVESQPHLISKQYLMSIQMSILQDLLTRLLVVELVEMDGFVIFVVLKELLPLVTLTLDAIV